MMVTQSSAVPSRKEPPYRVGDWRGSRAVLGLDIREKKNPVPKCKTYNFVDRAVKRLKKEIWINRTRRRHLVHI